MATIAMSCCGEGRGHAARMAALTDELRAHGHQILLFAPGDAFELLAPKYERSSVRVRAISGLRFAYDRQGRVRLIQSLFRNLPFLVSLPVRIRRLVGRLKAAAVDLVITDFEPILPRAAKQANIPFVTVDHQSFLYQGDLKELPWGLRVRGALMAPFTRAHYPKGARAAAVSGFFQPRLLPSPVPTKTTGILLRSEVRDLKPTIENHLVAYFRRTAPDELLQALATHTQQPVHIYGLGIQPDRDHLKFFPVSNQSFLADLGSCRALITTAGNQLIGEALHLGKPVFGLPEKGNWEQQLNAWFLESSGQGTTLRSGESVEDALQRFLQDIPRMTEGNRTTAGLQDGLSDILQLVEEIVQGLPPRSSSVTRRLRPAKSTPYAAPVRP